jgi:hypothetical protein
VTYLDTGERFETYERLWTRPKPADRKAVIGVNPG